ncbi:MAG: hypothetical protein JWM64_2483 [Frankiales bacterium]|nr:hypothetical protein [Frankiales bacterium]
MLGLLLAVATGFGSPQVLGRVPLDEVSGVAAGVQGTWVLEDSGNPPVLTRLDARARPVARVRLPVQARDWEDLAAAPDARGRPSLWVADTGDNRSVRERVTVLRVAEPSGSSPGPVTTYRFTYEDGPHDAEALLVLPGATRVAVVTKGLTGSTVYTAALDATGPQVLRRVADVRLRPSGATGGPAGPFGGVLVTGGAVSPDGSRLVLRTYTDVHEWPLLPDLAATFAQSPVRSTLPTSPQGEAVSYTRDGQGLLVASEGEGTPLVRLARLAPPETPSPRASAGPSAGPSPSASAEPVAARPAAGPSRDRRPWYGAAALLLAALLAAGRSGRRRRQG